MPTSCVGSIRVGDAGVMCTTLTHVISLRTVPPPPQQPAPTRQHHAPGCPSAADTPHTPPPGHPASADSDAHEPATAAAACHSPCVPRVNPPSVVCAPSTPAIVYPSVAVRLRILSCVCAGPRPELVSGGGRASSYAGTPDASSSSHAPRPPPGHQSPRYRCGRTPCSSDSGAQDAWHGRYGH
jgi:hypothetical protein